MGNPGAVLPRVVGHGPPHGAGTVVNPESDDLGLRPEAGHRGPPSGTGDLSLYLAVAVDPVTAPAGTVRTVTAAAHRRLARRDRRRDQRLRHPRTRSGSGAGPSTSATARCGPFPRDGRARPPRRPRTPTAPASSRSRHRPRHRATPTARSSRPTAPRTSRSCRSRSTSPTPRPGIVGAADRLRPAGRDGRRQPVGHAARRRRRAARRGRARRDLVAARAAVRPVRAPDHRAARASCARVASSSAAPRPASSRYRYEAGTNDAADATASGTYPAAAPDRDPVEHAAARDRVVPGPPRPRPRDDLRRRDRPDLAGRRAVVAVTVVYSAVSQ